MMPGFSLNWRRTSTTIELADGTRLAAGGDAHVVAYVGHNHLMDLTGFDWRGLASRADAPLPDLNDRTAGSQLNFGVRASGMRVTSVVKGSNAERLGLLPGDVVLAVNGRDLPSAVPLLELLGIYDSKTPMTFRVERDGKSAELSGVYEPEMMPNVVPIFAHVRPSGRVDLVRKGNTVRATSTGVAAFTLLLSPDMFDFTRPVTVVANGRTVFDGRVTPSVRTLLKWAAADNDRTMLFGAELPVTLP